MIGGRLPRTAVVLHRSGIGDLVWHLPYIRAAAARSADGKVMVIARPSSRPAELLSAEDCVSEVVEFDLGRLPTWIARLKAQLALRRTLRERGVERILIFSNRVRYAIIALLAGVPRRAGFGFSFTERLLLNEPPYITRHAGDGNWVYPEASAFAVAHGLVEAPVVPRMRVPDDLLAAQARRFAGLGRPVVAFAIGASDPRRNWGPVRFAALAHALLDRGATVVLIGGPAERAMAEQIQASMPSSRRDAIIALTQPSVLISAAAFRQCDLCIGNDTGALNMAAANGIPCLGLFGISPPLRHDPCLHALSASSMEAIAASAVLAAATRLGLLPADSVDAARIR